MICYIAVNEINFADVKNSRKIRNCTRCAYLLKFTPSCPLRTCKKKIIIIHVQKHCYYYYETFDKVENKPATSGDIEMQSQPRYEQLENFSSLEKVFNKIAKLVSSRLGGRTTRNVKQVRKDAESIF